MKKIEKVERDGIIKEIIKDNRLKLKKGIFFQFERFF